MKMIGLKDWGHGERSARPSVHSSGSRRATSRPAPSTFASPRVRHSSRAVILGSLAAFWTVLFGVVVLVSLRSGSAAEKRVEAPAVVIQKPAPTEMVEVLVPVRDIPSDQQLEPSMFIKVWRPKMAVAPATFRSFDEIRGMYAKNLLPAHQPLTREAATNERPQNAVASNIPEGFRAVTISVNATTSVEGWARAGAKVDVHWIADVSGERSARVLVQNARVLSAERQVDPRAEPGAPVPATVTLLVSERDAQKVSLAQTAGSLVMHLRGANDVKSSSDTGVLTLGSLMGKADGDLSNSGVEGIARIRGKNGEYEELAIVGRRIIKKSAALQLAE